MFSCRNEVEKIALVAYPTVNRPPGHGLLAETEASEPVGQPAHGGVTRQEDDPVDVPGEAGGAERRRRLEQWGDRSADKYHLGTQRAECIRQPDYPGNRGMPR